MTWLVKRGMRIAAAWMTGWRRLSAPLSIGWISGRFASPRRVGRRQQDYFLYVPATVTRRERVPLLVMLHGCSQDARAFAEGTRMNELAEEHRFIVLYPQQSQHANAMRCWNWFDLDTTPGRAREAATLAALVRNVARRYPVDRSRVYVAGISAGGAMTAMLVFRYGAMFAACAIVAGVMYRAADSTLAALQAMHGGARVSPETAAGEAARGEPRHLGFVPALVMHGSGDRVVHPRNADQIVGQFRRFAELVVPPKPLADPVERQVIGAGRSYRQRDYTLNDRVLLRSILVEGLGHAWSGGDERHRFNDAAQPDASRLIWDFMSAFRRPPHSRWPVTRFWARLLRA